MTPPRRRETSDGFEHSQFERLDSLGHFALTAHLLPLLRREDPRVVTVSSIANRKALINFDDLQAKRDYRPMAVYGQSKLAELMFAFEPKRRGRLGSHEHCRSSGYIAD